MNDKLQETINALRAAGDEAGAKAVEELRAEFARTMEQYHTGQRASYENGRKDEAEKSAAMVKDAARYLFLKDAAGVEWDNEYRAAFMVGKLDSVIDGQMFLAEIHRSATE